MAKNRCCNWFLWRSSQSQDQQKPITNNQPVQLSIEMDEPNEKQSPLPMLNENESRKSFWNYFKDQNKNQYGPSHRSKLNALTNMFKFKQQTFSARGFESDGTVQNVRLEIKSRVQDIIYCENNRLDQQYLQKYFKFVCKLCSRLTSHILQTQCCQDGICYECAIKLQSCLTQNQSDITECPCCTTTILTTYILKEFNQKSNHQKFLLPLADLNGSPNKTNYKEQSAIKPTRLNFPHEQSLFDKEGNEIEDTVYKGNLVDCFFTEQSHSVHTVSILEDQDSLKDCQSVEDEFENRNLELIQLPLVGSRLPSIKETEKENHTQSSGKKTQKQECLSSAKMQKQARIVFAEIPVQNRALNVTLSASELPGTRN